MCLDNIFHFVLYSETKRNALALLSCIYKKKKMIGMEQGVNESVFSQTKVKRGRKYFLPSWELLICQMWVLQEW